MTNDRTGRALSVGAPYVLVGRLDVDNGADSVFGHSTDDTFIGAGSDVFRPLVRYAYFGTAYDTNAGLTAANVNSGGIDSYSFRIPIPYDCVLVRCGVSAQHIDAGPPGNWTLDIYKNDSASPDATFDFALNASLLTDQTTTGAPSTELTFVADDRVGMQLSGSSLDGIAAQVVIVLEQWL
jgi:hypothetical protein